MTGTGATSAAAHGGTAAAATAPGPAVALSLAGVRAAYGGIEVLHGIDLDVPVGGVFALLGPNGAGKSTILKVAGGRVRPTTGTASVFGEPLAHHRPDRLASLGVCSLPEGRGVFPNLTVAENLLMWTYSAPVSAAELEERAYAHFPRLAGRRRQKAGSLSGGEQQMLAIARAFAGTPRLLLLDEISMGLAPNLVAELFEVVDRLVDRGVTVVLAEQFVHAALGLAAAAAVVVQGRVTAVGAPDDIAEAAAAAYLTGTPGIPRP